MKTTILLQLFAIATLYSASINAQQSDDWITRIEDVPQDVTFYCNSSLQTGYPYNISTPDLWMLPNLTNIGLDYNDGHVSVSENGWRLDIIQANVDDFGVYHCMMKTDDTDEWFLVKLGLNIRGPYFEDLWKKYEMNVIIAFSAMFAFLFIAAVIILVYTFRYTPHEEQKDDYNNATPIDAFGVKTVSHGTGYTEYVNENGGTGYDNKGYETLNEVKHRSSYDNADTYL